MGRDDGPGVGLTCVVQLGREVRPRYGCFMSTDWAAWSREAVQMMQQRNAAWLSRFQLASSPYRWDRTTGTITFKRATGSVVADAVFVGTASTRDRSFLWSWANDQTSEVDRARVASVRAFGAANDLSMLTLPEWPGGRPQALEALAIAGRVLDAEGVFVDEHDGLTVCLALFNFREMN